MRSFELLACVVVLLGGCSSENPSVDDVEAPDSGVSPGAGGNVVRADAGKGGTAGTGGSTMALGHAGTGGNVGTGGATGSGAAGTGGATGSGGFVPPVCAAGSGAVPSGAPMLAAGTFSDISPKELSFGGGANLTQGMTIDPCNPYTVYVAICAGSCNASATKGLFRSTDGGSSWTNLHAFDSPNNVRVDPGDPLHLYVTDGVCGGTNGFYVSHDGGKTFAMPDGFKTAAQSVNDFDVYHVDVDPTDFKHVLLTFHWYWHSGTDYGYGTLNSGVLESTDGGDSWTEHQPNAGWAGAGGYNVFFLYSPALGIGDKRTWLYGTQGKGYWRTTDAGGTWTKVTSVDMTHGGGQIYYAKDGTLYASGTPHLIRSKDNGATWTEIGPQNAAYYFSVIGDGTNLYASGGGPFVTAKENADTVWTNYNAQTFGAGPFQMAFDSAHGILYSASQSAGVWVLKVKP